MAFWRRHTVDWLTSGAAASQARGAMASPAAMSRGANSVPAIGRNNEKAAQMYFVDQCIVL